MSGPIMRAVDSVTLRGLAASIAATFCLMGAASTAKAQALTSNSDIVGLRTTMTRDQIKQMIQQEFGTSEFPAKTMKLIASGYSRDVGLGFTAEIVSAQDKEANKKRMDELNHAAEQRRAAGCNTPLCQVVASGLIKDTLDVYVDPTAGSASVLGLVRRTEYPQPNMLQDVFLQALVEKYGKPSWTDNFQNYYWADTATQSELSECSQFADKIADPNQFISVMNGFGNGPSTGGGRNKTKPPRCSVYLKVTIWWVGGAMGTPEYNTKRVKQFAMSLVNVRASYNALSAYAAAFWAAADKAQKDNTATESQNKPRL